MDNKPKSISELNKYISKFWPKVKVAKGKYYYYLYSDDNEIGKKISTLYSSEIQGMWPLTAFTFEQWKQSIQHALDDKQGGYGENPVFENKLSFKLKDIIKEIYKNR